MFKIPIEYLQCEETTMVPLATLGAAQPRGASCELNTCRNVLIDALNGFVDDVDCGMYECGCEQGLMCESVFPRLQCSRNKGESK